mgnify:CR=1 FL=1
MKWPALLRKLRRPSGRTPLAGHLDRFERRVVAGWAADTSDFSRPVQVVLVVDGMPAAMTEASALRPDLTSAGIGEGRHAYEFAIPNLSLRGARQVETFALRMETAKELGLADEAGALRRGLDAARFAQMATRGGGRILRLGTRAVPARRDVARRDHERSAPGPVAFLDICDLLAVLEERALVTGIQRVVSGLILTSLSQSSRLPAFEFCAPAEDGEIVVLPGEGLRRLVGKALSGTAAQAELSADVAAIRDEGRRAIFRPGDRYVITGAYWIIPDYAPTLLGIRARGVRICAYIHDLIPFTAGRFVDAASLAEVRERGMEVFSLCDFFLTNSSFVERQLGCFLSTETGRRPPARVVPLPHELPRGPHMAQVDAVPAHPRPYVLCVSTLEGRKNHLLLFDVWAALLRKYGAEAVPDLVLVGHWGWGIAEFRDLCRVTGFLAGRIVVKHDLGDGELLALYRGCLFTAFPSFVEGWGMPVGESLAAGKLCVASKSSSIPEVGGDFCDYIDPCDPLSAFEVFERAIFDPSHRRDRERAIAAAFRPRSWDETTFSFHEAVEALAEDSAASVEKVPLLKADIAYSLENLPGDVLRPWSHKVARLALAEGWHGLESWGAWSSRPEAKLRFFTDEAPGEELVVTLRLVPPPGLDEARLRLESGGMQEEARLRGAAPQEIRLGARVEKGGEVELTLLSDPRDLCADGLRDLHVGLAAFSFSRVRDI